MNVVRAIEDLRGALRGRDGVGFVPTMGALHRGHLSLVDRARRECSTVVVSIFVNPAQFGPREDLARYPRPLDADLQGCERAGVDVVFVPSVEEMYPQPPRTRVHVDGLSDRMEGAVRPGHFGGVALVVCKLLSIVGPCRAYFGRKDAQQLAVVTRMARDLNLPACIVPCDTVRDPDGLALSSRNAYLSPHERERALALPRALHAVADLARAGQTDAAVLTDHGRKILEHGPDAVDYLEIVDPETMQPVVATDTPSVVCGAIRVGGTRLIDNVTIGGTA